MNWKYDPKLVTVKDVEAGLLWIISIEKHAWANCRINGDERASLLSGFYAGLQYGRGQMNLDE